MCNDVMDFWRVERNYDILMRKEFDKNELLLKKEKQMCCCCLN